MSKEVGYLCMGCRIYSVVLQDDEEIKKGKKCSICKKSMTKMEVKEDEL